MLTIPWPKTWLGDFSSWEIAMTVAGYETRREGGHAYIEKNPSGWAVYWTKDN